MVVIPLPRLCVDCGVELNSENRSDVRFLCELCLWILDFD